jgi:hypothetical protein
MDSVLTIQNLLCFINSGAVLAFWQSAMSTYEQEYLLLMVSHSMSVSLSCSSQSASQQPNAARWQWPLAGKDKEPAAASKRCLFPRQGGLSAPTRPRRTFLSPFPR